MNRLIVAVAILSVAHAVSVEEKCAHSIPEANCMMYIGENIVFDSTTGKCTVQNSGCMTADELQPYTFSSMDECNAACTKPFNKCAYERPEITCMMYIGQNIVYDAKTKRCVTQTSGCSRTAIAPYRFNSMADCISACVN